MHSQQNLDANQIVHVPLELKQHLACCSVAAAMILKEQAAGHAKRAKHAKQAPTSNQEGRAVGAKLVPEGGEEVDELEDLSAGHAACQCAP